MNQQPIQALTDSKQLNDIAEPNERALDLANKLAVVNGQLAKLVKLQQKYSHIHTFKH